MHVLKLGQVVNQEGQVIWPTTTTHFLGTGRPEAPGRGMPLPRRGVGIPVRCGDSGRPGDACRTALLVAAGVRCCRRAGVVVVAGRGGESREGSVVSLPWCCKEEGCVIRDDKLGKLRLWCSEPINRLNITHTLTYKSSYKDAVLPYSRCDTLSAYLY